MIIFNRKLGDGNIGGWLVANQGSSKDEILLEPKGLTSVWFLVVVIGNNSLGISYGYEVCAQTLSLQTRRENLREYRGNLACWQIFASPKYFSPHERKSSVWATKSEPGVIWVSRWWGWSMIMHGDDLWWSPPSRFPVLVAGQTQYSAGQCWLGHCDSPGHSESDEMVIMLWYSCRWW